MKIRGVFLSVLVVTAIAQQANFGYERLGERRDVLPPLPGMDIIHTFLYDTMTIIHEFGHWLAANTTALE
ncbi:hypothetical protein JMJ77_0014812 [Colletotrichum scovillei]|uniref:Uncharacterized protein n=1 Tax=Colletotrichum scovillei TaxID=1209932 RepID=A0A9P7UFB1_9PEZI|nr:hypothetical protein JMJ77_0014812 [Colletotrichum scovillei]KAG7056458.1 hypothetical protein JMJ78_0000257 [Colletotrichum scovillei]KAG7066355.1 hypothetical protein JMJ76_0000218 [Colletotrichum scovillei]